MDQKNDIGETVYQWLEDGKSAYPLVGLPIMDVENICAMFDITEKKREKLVMRQVDLTRQCRDAMRNRAFMPRRDNVLEQEPGSLFRVDSNTGKIVEEGAGE